MANIFLLSDDLLDASRIDGAARQCQIACRTFRSWSELRSAEDAPDCVLVDLANPGLQIEELTRHFQERAPAARIIAFGAHVQATVLKRAREAGCHLVLPRSRFFEDLPNDLPRWATGQAVGDSE